MGQLTRGLLTNMFGLLVLAGVCQIQGVLPCAVIALAIQYAVFFLHGLPYTSEKFYDLSGSATHLAVVAMSLNWTQRVRSPRQIFSSLFSVVWMVRLGTFLFIRISRDSKDSRFDSIKKHPLNFMSAWTLQAAWVVLTQMPIILVNSVDDRTTFLTVIDMLCFAGWIAGFVLECSADFQKFTFRQDPSNHNKFITSGVWRYSRHPNYAGEIFMWITQALSVSALYSEYGNFMLWAWLSPCFTILLLLKVSGIPMVERAGQKKWGNNPEYIHYMSNTSMLIPWKPAGKLQH